LRVLGNAKDDTAEMLATVPVRGTMLVRHLFVHDVPGYVIEVVSGQPLDQFLNDRIFVRPT
jgi:CubicO group peptidase (beta-lactamase class C family)